MTTVGEMASAGEEALTTGAIASQVNMLTITYLKTNTAVL